MNKSKFIAKRERHQRLQMLRVRCTLEEHGRWRSKSNAMRVSLSELVRNLLDGTPIARASRVPKVDQQLLLEIKRIGGNLNQIARLANTRFRAGDEIDVVALQSRLITIERMLDDMLEKHSR